MKTLFNIFSGKGFKKKNTIKPKIIIDYREKNSLVISELVSLGLETEIKELKVADYIANDVAIERKSVSDFINSMKSGRLVSQLENLQQYKDKLLIIEGIDEQELYSDEFSEHKIRMHPNSVRGFLLSILLKYRVPIIFTKNYADTARFISVLLKKEEAEFPLNVKKKALNKKEQMQYILEGFPGIGPKTSRKLLKKFKTIKSVISATEEELRETIGKKASHMLKIIEQKF